LPKSHVRAWSRKLTFVPAGYRFYGWQKPRALSRVGVKESFGMPPHRYLTSQRIERAERRLSVTEIGFDVGFSETSSFTSALCKVTGETPTDYRRSLA
jgi:AraC-like DNA-binding protein